MAARNTLPKRIRERVAEMPEHSYGVNRVVVVLDDGSEVSDVLVAWAREVIKVGRSEHVPFDTTRVVDVRLQD